MAIPTATATPEPTVEGYATWLIGRRDRRRDTAEPHDRRRLYEERCHFLWTSFSFELRQFSARRSVATLSDISGDERSPNYATMHAPASLGNAQTAVNFLQSLQPVASSSSGFSTDIDTMHNAIGRGNLSVENLMKTRMKQWKRDLK